VTRFEEACGAWLESNAPSDAEFVKLLNAAFEVLIGMTRGDLATYLKIDESTVSRWMKGSTCPQLLIQRKVIQHLVRRAKVADLMIVALPDPSDPTVWSVGTTLPDGTYVGVAVPDKALIADAKEAIRRRALALLEAS
jgi:DNA-binding XRE family transcriptional regulator